MDGLGLGELVGRGRRCDVFAWGEKRVIKVFAPDVRRDYLESEQELTRILYDAGLPVPAVGDIVDLGGRLGLIYEWLKGPTATSLLRGDLGGAPALMRSVAEVHAHIHSISLSSLPSQRQRLIGSIERAPSLPDETKRAALKALSLLPDGDSVCHGDLNLDNLIFTADGMRVIDWDNATRGNPLCDVARSLLMLDAAPAHAGDEAERRVILEVLPGIRDAYLSRYLELRPGTMEEIDAWRLPLAAARLRECIAEEDVWLRSTIAEMAARSL